MGFQLCMPKRACLSFALLALLGIGMIPGCGGPDANDPEVKKKQQQSAAAIREDEQKESAAAKSSRGRKTAVGKSIKGRLGGVE